MKVALVQTDIIYCRQQDNFAKLDRMLDGTHKADLYILPEMFSTGFCVAPSCAIADLEGESTLKWLNRTAKRLNAAISGSVIVQSKSHSSSVESYFNRLYFVCPDGHFYQYDKRHLFSYGKEKESFSAGNRRVVAEYKGWKILLQICYDLRFPVFSRNRNDYDAIIYTSSWPDTRIRVWDTLLSARAIENVSYVIGVNRVGKDADDSFCGHSALFDFKGQQLTALSIKEEVIVSSMEKEPMTIFRKKFPALGDADEFTI